MGNYKKKATGNRRWKKRRTGNVGIEVRKEKKIIRGKGGGKRSTGNMGIEERRGKKISRGKWGEEQMKLWKYWNRREKREESYERKGGRIK